MPKFSIVIPVYKVEAYLDACVKSVLMQTYPDFEVILVDDGSPDHCGQICDTYAQKDARVRVFHKENGGLSSARNAGTEIACGEYVIYLDSDDFWMYPEGLSEIAAHLEETNADLLLFPFVRYYGENKNNTYSLTMDVDRQRITDENTDSAIEYLIKNNIYRAAAWNKVVRRRLIEAHNLCFKEGYLSEDMAWCGDLLQRVSRFDYYSVPFYAYRQQRAGSITAGKKEKLVADKLYMCEKGYTQAISLENAVMGRLVGSFYAYEYSVALGVSAGVRDRVILKKMQELQALLDYDICDKVKRVNRLKHYLGYHLTRAALCFFVKIKR